MTDLEFLLNETSPSLHGVLRKVFEERDTLRAELEAEKLMSHTLRHQYMSSQAELAKLKEQEPVGEVSGNDWGSALLFNDMQPGTQLYAAPVSSVTALEAVREACAKIADTTRAGCYLEEVGRAIRALDLSQFATQAPAVPKMMDYAPIYPDEPHSEQEQHAAYVRGWNACRTAYLAASGEQK